MQNEVTGTIAAPAPRVARARKVKVNNKLSTTERTTFKQCEKQIAHHFATFRTAAQSLVTIRDGRLYRETHSTFEDYCRERWEMSKTQANRLIAAGKVVENVATVISADVASNLTESVIRPLTNLPPLAQKKAMAQAVQAAPSATGLTAKVVSAAAHSVSPRSFRPTKKSSRTNGGGDLIRRSELFDEINRWEKEVRANKTFDKLTPAKVVIAIRGIIKGL